MFPISKSAILGFTSEANSRLTMEPGGKPPLRTPSSSSYPVGMCPALPCPDLPVE